MADLHSKENVKKVVKSALDKGKRKIPDELYDQCLQDVGEIDDNYQKIIGFGCKYQLAQPALSPLLYVTYIFSRFY